MPNRPIEILKSLLRSTPARHKVLRVPVGYYKKKIKRVKLGYALLDN